MFVAVTFYGMATFEGSMTGRSRASTPCRTTPIGPWATCTPAPSAGSLMISVGALYYLIPRVFGPQEMYSTRLINGTSG